MTQIKNKGKGQLFENPILEKLTKTSPYTMLSVTGGFIILSFYLHVKYGIVESTAWGIALFFIGLGTWTLFEYVMHRYVFHFINESEWSQKFHRMAHGIHHEFPRDSDRLFMPPIPAIILASVILGICYLLMGAYAYLFYPGFILGYVMYVSLHYAMHRYKPPRFMKSLWAHHALHHYKHPDRAYGVSTTIWDHIFQTLPPAKNESEKN